MKPIQQEKLAPNGRVHESWWTCPFCGERVDEHDRFCRWCGRRFTP